MALAVSLISFQFGIFLIVVLLKWVKYFWTAKNLHTKHIILNCEWAAGGDYIKYMCICKRCVELSEFTYTYMYSKSSAWERFWKSDRVGQKHMFFENFFLHLANLPSSTFSCGIRRIYIFFCCVEVVGFRVVNLKTERCHYIQTYTDLWRRLFELKKCWKTKKNYFW